MGYILSMKKWLAREALIFIVLMGITIFLFVVFIVFTAADYLTR